MTPTRNKPTRAHRWRVIAIVVVSVVGGIAVFVSRVRTRHEASSSAASDAGAR